MDHRTESAPNMNRYLLLSNWPVHRYEGGYWTDNLWAKDLELHLDYIQKLTLACPVVDGKAPDTYARLTDETQANLELVAMPSFNSLRARLLNSLPFLLRLRKVAKSAEIVHFTAASHPLLFGCIIPHLRRQGKNKLVACVESSFWRKPSARFVKRWISQLAERNVKAAVSSSHVTFLTQASYIPELTSPENTNHVVHAVWIDEAAILPDAGLSERLAAKEQNLSHPLRLAFFGQLRPEKGPDVLIEALKIVAASGTEVELDIYGKGPIEDALRTQSTELGAKVRFMGMVKYGPEFFEAMRQHDALALPTRSDEQPRIVFDAYSQGLPVIANSAPGLRTVVRDQETGLFYERDNAASLAKTIVDLAADPALLAKLSRTALESARHVSHASMHRYRAKVLREAFPQARQLQTVA